MQGGIIRKHLDLLQTKLSALLLFIVIITDCCAKEFRRKSVLEKSAKICLHISHELTKSITSFEKGCPRPENNMYALYALSSSVISVNIIKKKEKKKKTKKKKIKCYLTTKTHSTHAYADEQ
uniref:Uncharacterized protein n=1 Tax=Glossina palpalis gambiensis TaxID=67801 RepID=A0A1B0AS96_9MUSC